MFFGRNRFRLERNHRSKRLVRSPSPLLAKRNPRLRKTESVFAFSIRFANAPESDARFAIAANRWVETEFPLLISPHQPFKDLGAISWEPTADLKATVAFAGETFETEDQRNWTDASFKTYCTPLERPFPVEIETGSLVDQRITVELRIQRCAIQYFQRTRPRINFCQCKRRKIAAINRHLRQQLWQAIDRGRASPPGGPAPRSLSSRGSLRRSAMA